MKTYERLALFAGLIVVGITCVYRYVLNDEQRAAIQEGANELRAASREVSDSVSPLVSDGPTKSEEEAAAARNRATTAREWAALGY